jgi:hypothetical protein
MPTPPIPPEKLQEALAAYEAHGNNKDAAESLGLAASTFTGRLNKARSQVDPAVQESMAAIGTELEPALVWAKTKSEDGTSYSVLLKPPQQGVEDILERVKNAFDGLTPAPPVEVPENVMGDLLTVYPLMDVHFGMLAWGRETGDVDYDMGLATADMRHAFAKVSMLTPASEDAVLLIGGDFFHADDNRAETPQSKHKLDVDGRQFKVLECGVALVAEVTDKLLSKHNHVTVRVLRGNHDEHAHMVLTFALAERYREEPRVSVEKTPRDLFMKQWGKCLISAHHGDKAKPQQLTLYLSDVCPYWSETRHRFMFTGHVHHDAAKDIGPLKWESLRAFCPPDSYASGMGYSSRRALQAITFHKQDGLVLRAIDPIDR